MSSIIPANSLCPCDINKSYKNSIKTLFRTINLSHIGFFFISKVNLNHKPKPLPVSIKCSWSRWWWSTINLSKVFENGRDLWWRSPGSASSHAHQTITVASASVHRERSSDENNSHTNKCLLNVLRLKHFQLISWNNVLYAKYLHIIWSDEL